MQALTTLFSPVFGWLGLGGVIIVAAIGFGLYFPRYLYMGFIVAAVTAAGMFVFEKGAYYAHTTDTKAEGQAANGALKQEEAAAAAAARSVHSKPGWLRHRDPYARD